MIDLDIPFIDPRNADEVRRAEQAVLRSVDDPAVMADGWRNVRQELAGGPVAADGALEAQIAEWTTAPAALLEILATHRKSVARVLVSDGVDFRNRRGNWNGTGFLVGPNLFLTNHHVINSPDVARKAEIEFGYETPVRALLDVAVSEAPAVQSFALDPARLFVTSPVQNGGLDFTLVWIDSEAARRFGFIPMGRGSYKVSKREPTYVIHHPEGRKKEASLDDTELLGDNHAVIHYAADTKSGSSGSPVFNKHGGLVALHHAGPATSKVRAVYPDTSARLNDGRQTSNLNEGIKIAAIAVFLERLSQRVDEKAPQAKEVLKQIGESDTVTGYFGVLGRESDADTDYELVVDLHKGKEHDLDIGFWNIRWFNNTWDEPGRLEAVARVIVDLNLDVWGLSEVSPTAVTKLVEYIHRAFGQNYLAGFSEPDASQGKQSTAMIWKETTVEGSREEWPEDLHRLFVADSHDSLGLEAVHGRIFNRYPGLFRFKSKSGDVDVYVVPLHLKAKSEGSLRRRLASRILVHAVDKMITEHGRHRDWILAGDLNATLASGDLDHLSRDGFVPLGAKDEASGAFTYLRSPHSMIDRIFVSQNMRKVLDDDDILIVAHDNVLDKFVPDVSDHRPIAMRLSLTGTNRRFGENDVGALFDRVVGRDTVAADGRGEGCNCDPTRIAIEWISDGLNKREFMIANARSFSRLRDVVNRRLNGEYGAAFKALTDRDFWAVVYTEAGLRNGNVDPQATHSEGERGLLPLPSNIRFWNGADAPDWNRLTTLHDNLFHYGLYMGQLKNKAVRRFPAGMLYRDLFAYEGIDGDSAREATLLTGIIHGYFLDSNYGAGTAPIEHVLDGIANNLAVDRILQHSGYVHAGTSILRNRQLNLEAANRDFRSFL